MKNNKNTPPKSGEREFSCPHCDVYAQQDWEDYRNHYVATCLRCQKLSIWIDGKMIYPLVSSAEKPNDDMPKDVKEIYEEARQVQPFSPRATAALLRVALEKLTEHLGEKEGNLNTRIKNLKSKGLPQRVIDSLDIVRVTANEGGSHSGQIDITGRDNEEIVIQLFSFVNVIVVNTIAVSKKIKKAFNTLPESKKIGIKNRDKELPF